MSMAISTATLLLTNTETLPALPAVPTGTVKALDQANTEDPKLTVDTFGVLVPAGKMVMNPLPVMPIAVRLPIRPVIPAGRFPGAPVKAPNVVNELAASGP